MAMDQLRYDRMVETALRGVVREALRQVEKRGLPGDHHFYITFRTGAPGVQVPDFLRAQYPQEMTIVLQYQFYGLKVTQDTLSVTLSFGGKHENLVIPFSTITTFADPHVNFALQFQPFGVNDGAEAESAEEGGAKAADDGADSEPADEAGKSGTVVTLDAFRKK